VNTFLQVLFSSPFKAFRNFKFIMQVGIGIIGCGLIGETHAECLDQLGNPPILFFDQDDKRSSQLAKKYAGTSAKTLNEVLDSLEVHAVYICTHHETHAPIAISAARHKKHLFLEKPMALTEKECFDIVQAVQQAGVMCMSGFKLRYYPLVAKMKTLVQQPLILNGQILDSRWPDDSWANDPVKGGGNVLSQGCHAIDLLCWLANSKPVRVYGEARNLRHPSLDIVDSLAATISFESGAVASLTIADTGEFPLISKFSFEAADNQTTLHLHNRLKSLYINSAGNITHEHTEEEQGFLEENREFLTALRDKRQPLSNELDGLHATMILLRAIEASRSGIAQSLEDLP